MLQWNEGWSDDRGKIQCEKETVALYHLKHEQAGAELGQAQPKLDCIQVN